MVPLAFAAMDEYQQRSDQKLNLFGTLGVIFVLSRLHSCIQKSIQFKYIFYPKRIPLIWRIIHYIYSLPWNLDHQEETQIKDQLSSSSSALLVIEIPNPVWLYQFLEFRENYKIG